MKTKYFYNSPRGFANEADVYAVPAEVADDWEEWFCSRDPQTLYAATALVRVSRKEAERLIRQPGVGLLIDERDYNWEDCRTDRLTPASLKSARRTALAWRQHVAADDAFAAAVDAEYAECPEYVEYPEYAER